ncbi:MULTISPECIES: hypothetical protein [unclassified Streptomyces]|uniref:hypothetical protein n=1 Tax=unclassified Streptomyces TaxID=2593676 RepID=UPI000DADDEB2|nr:MULTISPECIES: hypothetical protein [unclassified Streptomyces]PZT71699.1 hypothetical protein DNK55_31620 [Streptomyces sp. AC1-42T]PZT73174.1 hypothetical protein DNK56_33455 [Streptomyces sp. AC1-42W]
MLPRNAKLRTVAATATMTAALTGLAVLGTGTANAAGWPPLQPGAALYTGANGTGTALHPDLGDFGTCHTTAEPVRSIQIVNGSASVLLYSGADCTGNTWSSGTLTQSNLPQAKLSYRVVSAR